MKKTIVLFLLLTLWGMRLQAQALNAVISSQSNVSCYAANTGSLTAAASGGTAPYTYSWNTGGQSPTITGLAAGSYTCTVTDAASGMVTVTGTITQPSQLSVAMSSVPSTCGNANGSATAAASGGVGPYTYSWSPGNSTTAAASNLTAGTYTVMVTDANACTVSNSIVVTNLPSPIVSPQSIMNPSCFGGSNGSASVAVTSGTAPFTYTWSPIGGTGNTALGLSAGNYTCTVSDANGCSTSTTVLIHQPLQLSVAMSSTPATCGNPDGSASAMVTGGTTPYTYSWTPCFATTATANNLIARTYTITIADATGCTVTGTTTVMNQGGPTLTLQSMIPPSCANGNNGSANMYASGGTPPYTYSWLPISWTTPTVNSLWSGTYTCTVTDANGCSSSVSFNVPNPPVLTMSVTATPTGCSNNTGTATGTASGGTIPFTYSWSPNPGTGQGTPNAGALSAGSYTLTVTDANGCSASGSATVVSSTGLSQTVNARRLQCIGGNNGAATAVTSGGTPPYTYSWSTGSTADSIYHMAAGTYTVTVTDHGGCLYSNAALIQPPPTIHIATSSTSANCAANGSASVSMVYSATAPFTYSWSTTPPQSASTASNLAAGTYSVTVTDANGCVTAGQASVSLYCRSLINGRVFKDTNGNCIQDPGEPGIAGVVLQTTNPYQYATTDANGDYSLLTTTINNNLQVIVPSCYTAGCQSASVPVNLSAPGDTSLHNNFALTPLTGFDLAIHPGWNPSHPGFQKNYWIFYYNQGPTAHSGTVTFAYDSNLVFNSATQNPVVDTVHHTLVWTFSSVAPNTSCCLFNTPSQLHAYFTVPATMPLSTMLHSHFEIDPMSGDMNPYNNILDSDEPVTGSHDPNSKTVTPAGLPPNGWITQQDSTLFYTINFQNSGTDTAFTVVVKDTLSPYLDPATLELGATSHPCTFDLSGNGVLTWRFDNILLPDSTVNEPGSNGFVSYRIKQRHNNMPGTQITNKAYVYFDFNAAVITNTTLNTIMLITGAPAEPNESSMITVRPNPFSDFTTIYMDGPDTPRDLILYDLTGREISRIHSSENQVSIGKASLAPGMYLVKIFSGNTLIGEKKLLRQ